MSKLKVHSGTKDRVEVTKNGKVRVKHSRRNHFLEKKTGARKRNLAGYDTLVGKQSRTVKTRIGV